VLPIGRISASRSERGAVETAGEVRVVGFDVEGGDHAALAQVFDLRVVGERGEGGADFCALFGG
jgi:hypothetical protein